MTRTGKMKEFDKAVADYDEAIKLRSQVLIFVSPPRLRARCSRRRCTTRRSPISIRPSSSICETPGLFEEARRRMVHNGKTTTRPSPNMRNEAIRLDKLDALAYHGRACCWNERAIMRTRYLTRPRRFGLNQTTLLLISLAAGRGTS